MKVKDFLKKVNVGTLKLPVYLQEGICGEPRKAVSFDFGDYNYDEMDRTVSSISIREDRVIVYYK